MYVLGSGGDDVNEYNLSTAWNVSTASYLQNFSVFAQETFPNGIFFKPDGLKMYVTGSSGDDVNEYNLSTAWDISTASYLQNFSVSAQETLPSDIFFKPDGLKMYIIGTSGGNVNEYTLTA
jgi:DNA-binding beta-propeller fold protein YncE